MAKNKKNFIEKNLIELEFLHPRFVVLIDGF